MDKSQRITQVIPFNNESPIKPGLRFVLSQNTLGKLERLAKARIWVNEPTMFDKPDGSTIESIARTVFASSDIEGESFGAENLEPFVAAITEPGEKVDEDLKSRLKTFRDQVDTYFWALGQKLEEPMTVEFIKEIHARMFATSKPEIAGQLKEKPVVIHYGRNGDQRIIQTIPPDQTAPFLAALCERVNLAFDLSRTKASASMFLAAAEFHCDFLAIHPFADGNGRTGRLLASYLLEKAGYHFSAVYPLDQIVLETRREYYSALFTAQRKWHQEDEDLTDWIAYFTETVFEQWERASRRLSR